VTRVLVAASNSIVRAGLESILRASPDLAVVDSSSDVATLAALIENYSPDVVLMELGRHDDEPVSENYSHSAFLHPSRYRHP